MSTEQLIKDRAKKHGKDKWSFEHDDLHKRLRVSTSETDFTAGATYFRDELLRGEMAAAMEWISLKGLYQEIDGRWYDKFGGKVREVAETTKDLLKLFENYKQKEDGLV